MGEDLKTFGKIVVPQHWLDEFYSELIKVGMDADMARQYTDGGCWEDYYSEGYSPREALEEDMSYWSDGTDDGEEEGA